MKTPVILLAVAILVAKASPAAAWDADRGDPVTDPPVADGPSTDWTPEPTPVTPPEGVYLVTDAYAGDTVVRNGSVTTYTTDTVHEITGSYARVLETVGTGAHSGFDGASFNGRASLTDGRPVAGTYYQNFVLTDNGFVPVSVVFFQDDSEVAPMPTSTIAPATPATAPSIPASLAPGASIEAPIERTQTPAVGYVSPWIDGPDRTALPPDLTTPPAPNELANRTIEVLRGRRISIMFSGPDVRAWRALSTEGTALGPLSGSAAEPFVIRWDRLAPPNTSWISRFVLDYADGTSHQLLVRVVVRAPGLVE